MGGGEKKKGNTMYLHLGADTVVRTADIVGVFDLENTTTGKITRQFLTRAEKAGDVVNITDELPKSFLLVGGRGEHTRVYIAQVSSATLKKRSLDPHASLR